MRQVRSVFMVILVVAIASFARTGWAQTTTGTEVKQFAVVSVDGNHVVVKDERGAAHEITVPDDFRLTVDGKAISVRELKPGMTGTARITTTTTVTPVTITEVKKGRVLKVSGNSIIVRTEEGNKLFSEQDVAKRGVKIAGRDGEPIKFSDLREGYELTATIVTQKPPQVMTQREVDAALKSAPAAPGAASPTRRTEAAPTGLPAAPSSERVASAPPAQQLPKTASALPLLQLIGSVALAIGVVLMARRQRA